MVLACSCAGDQEGVTKQRLFLLSHEQEEGRYDVKELSEAVRRNPTLQACLQMGGKLPLVS